jgi:hypothetical protein
LAESPDQQIVVRIQEEQPRIVGTYDSIDRGARIAEPFVAANIKRNRDIARRGLLQCGHDGVERNGRKVLDAVKVQILEGLDRLALAGSSQTRHKDDPQRTHMKLFSPERANALIPKLEPLLEELLTRRRDLAIKLLEADPALHHAPPSHRTRLAGVRSSLPTPRFGELKHEIGRLIYRIESLGCIVKDIDLGLVDFPAMREDEPVYLCWKMGERSALAWHRRGLRFPATPLGRWAGLFSWPRPRLALG